MYLDKINEADYVSADNAVCSTESNTSVDVLIQFYHNVESDTEDEYYCNSENIEDSSGI